MYQICTTLSSDKSIKVVLLASPGNPTGTLIQLKEIRRILDLEGRCAFDHPRTELNVTSLPRHRCSGRSVH